MVEGRLFSGGACGTEDGGDRDRLVGELKSKERSFLDFIFL